MSFVVSTLIDDIEADLYFRVASDPYFADITVLRERRSESVDGSGATIEEVNDVEDDIVRGLGVLNEKTGKLGAVVVVMEPDLLKGGGTLPQARYDANIELQVIVMPLMNNGDTGTHKSERQIALRLDRLLLGKRMTGTTTMLLHKGEAIVALRTNEVPEGCRGKRVVYHAECGQSIGEGETCAIPSGSVSAGLLTLTCATSGATIYYTTDGSYPGSANTGGATAYTVPFAVTSGQTIRVAAQKADKFASEVAQIAVS